MDHNHHSGWRYDGFEPRAGYERRYESGVGAHENGAARGYSPPDVSWGRYPTT